MRYTNRHFTYLLTYYTEDNNTTHQKRTKLTQTYHNSLTWQVFIHKHMIWFTWAVTKCSTIKDSCTYSLQPL